MENTRDYEAELSARTSNRELAQTIDRELCTAEFRELPYNAQMTKLITELAHLKGYVLPGEDNPDNLPVVAEVNYDKPWGGYITLRKVEKPEGDEIEKILIVRPTPDPIPEEWDIHHAYAQHLIQNLGKLGTSLSLQRHHHRQREEWAVLHGEGYHITSESTADAPELESLHFSRISEHSSNHVEHTNSTWHTVSNTGPEFLILGEMIYCNPGEPHSEEDIDRAYDLYSRAGTNKNI